MDSNIIPIPNCSGKIPIVNEDGVEETQFACMGKYHMSDGCCNIYAKLLNIDEEGAQDINTRMIRLKFPTQVLQDIIKSKKLAILNCKSDNIFIKSMAMCVLSNYEKCPYNVSKQIENIKKSR